jgi:WD40 repeat protein/serine/threonine protein kinase
MNETKHNLEEALFEAALERASAAERAVFLDDACRDHPALRARLDMLLEGHFHAEGFLKPAADGQPGPRAPDPPPPPPAEDPPLGTIGRYKLLQKIGEGGCGTVYMAEQLEPLRRRVALKVVKLGMDTRQVVARFEAERQALAVMDHPNIAKVFDAGATDSGRPYFVMELVRGVRITQFCDERQVPLRQRLDLFVQVCQAIQHAHQKGIIHRDIKPSNILVTLKDGVPVPKVIDFGIAKATHASLTDKTLFTMFEQFIGTPAYMSPEQAEVRGVDIDTRSDIYSLGVVLYELLTGRTPFDSKALLERGIEELILTLRQVEPPRPSTRLSTLAPAALETVARSRQCEVPKLVHGLRGDLDWIVMKCLEKDRARRYDAANDLAMDIQRHLANEPITARPPSTYYRVQKAWQRNKLLFTAGALVALIGVAGGGAVILVQRRANQEYRQRFHAYQMGRAGAALAAGQFDQLATALAQCPPEHRRWEWHYLSAQVQRWRQRTLFQLDQPARKLLLNRDGTLAVLMTGAQEGRIQIHRFPSGEKLATIEMLTSMWAPLALAPDGGLLAGSPNENRQTLQVWNTRTGERLKELSREGQVQCLAFSPDARWLVAAGGDSQLDCWNVGTWAPHPLAFQSDPATALAFTPDGRALAVGTGAGDIHLVDFAAGKTLARLSAGEGEIRTLAFSPDGKKLVSNQVLPALQRGLLRLWTLTNGSSKELGLSYGWIAQFSPDGRWIMNGDATLWDGASGELLSRLRLDDRSYGLATVFHPDGGIVSAGPGSGVILSTPHRPASERLLGHQASLRVLKFSPDGQTVASAGLGGAIRLWDLAGRRERESYAGHSTGVPALAWSPDGQSVVSGCFDRALHCWDPVTLRLRWSASMEAINARGAWWLEFSPDGKQILSSSENGVIGLWNSLTGASLGRMQATHTPAAMDGAAWSPDGTRIAGLFKDRIVLWRLAGWQEQWSMPAAANRCVRFSADGRWLAHANNDGTIGLRDTHDGRLIRSFERHHTAATSVAFSAEGRRLFSGGADGTVRVWDTRTGDELLQLQVMGDRLIWSVDLSPDGRTVAAADSDGIVTLWKTE